MMMTLSLNGTSVEIDSIEQLAPWLDGADSQERFELWVSAGDGPSLCMMRSGRAAFLMFLRYPGDAGLVSTGDPEAEGVAEFLLSNGQLEEYPRAWCVDVAQCYKAISDFVVKDGERSDGVLWAGDATPSAAS
jgi:hypothetical protein